MHLIKLIQYQYKIIGQLLSFIYKYISLKQWTFDDSDSWIMSMCMVFKHLKKLTEKFKFIVDRYNIVHILLPHSNSLYNPKIK